jgi:hypothetical protein
MAADIRIPAKNAPNGQTLPPNFGPSPVATVKYDGTFDPTGACSNDNTHWHPPVKHNKG